MKYVSIDIETTGLDPERHQILEIGAVVDDTLQPDVPFEQLPQFRVPIFHEQLTGDPYALALNAQLIREIAESGKDDPHGPLSPGKACLRLKRFLHEYLPANDKGQVRAFAAGKNFGSFDKLFIERLPGWKFPEDDRPLTKVSFNHRSLDPVLLFFDPKIDTELPSLQGCLERAYMMGLLDDVTRQERGFEVTHRALDDAWDVVRVLRAGWKLNFPMQMRAA